MNYPQFCCLFIAFFLISHAHSQSEAEPTSAYDCTTVHIDEVDPEELTKEEYLALLEQSLYSSIDQYSTCMDQVQAQMAASASSGGGASGGASGGGGGAQASQATSAQDSNSEMPESGLIPQGTTPMSSGAEHKVIPPKDNDSVVCQMLFEEISLEANTAEKPSLVEQYKNYDCGK